MTNNKEYYERLVMFRQHGIVKDRDKFADQSNGDWYYEMHILGYNYRLNDIQCALGISQLKKLDKFIARRTDIAHLYNQTFKDNEFFEMPTVRAKVKSSWHLYPIRLKEKYGPKKKIIFTRLRHAGLEVQVHYLPVYRHPYYQRLDYKNGICPRAEDFYQREISIPLYQSMSDKRVKEVCKIILEVLRKV